jgi:hypothetical protein
MQILALIAWDLRSILLHFKRKAPPDPLPVNRTLISPMSFLVASWNHRRTLMSIDKIVVIALAVAFFGGVILLAIKSKRDAVKEAQPPPSSDQSREGVALPFQPRENERQKSKK